jgi:23S rRNA-/tRNA-specific pseudouridylate synthase
MPERCPGTNWRIGIIGRIDKASTEVMSDQIYVRHPDYPNSSIELPIVHSDEHCIATMKPINLRYRVGKFSILNEVRANLQDSTVQALPTDHPGVRYDIESGPSGLFLLSKSKGSMNILQNADGSSLFELTFDMLCAKFNFDKGQEIDCSLRIAKHVTENRMVTSARTGKKSHTTVNFIE